LKAQGGTEIMMENLYSSLPSELLSNFQIIPGRIKNEELDENKIRISYHHDLPGDPAADYLKNEGWKKFHILVFVSNWQMQNFINYYKIPWSRCIVIENSIIPINDVNFNKPTDKIKLIYTSTPHRGLNVLLSVFPNLLEKYPNLELDVFSSFKLYGWDQRDKEFETLFDFCRNHPNINYHGSQPNDVVREALRNSHIFAYPSIWQETSCLCLIEAMSAGLICVHSNLGALYETSGNWTYQYHYQEDLTKHCATFQSILEIAIQNFIKNDSSIQIKLQNQKAYVDQIHNWNYRKIQWEELLKQIVSLPREFEKQDVLFSYKT
jgi:glycosyltransferase involved in cell wall biosynthesis